MPLTALALVLVAGLIHAAWNIIAKRSGGDARFACISGLAGLIFWAPLSLTLAVQQCGAWPLQAWLCVGVSGCIHVAYYLTLLRGYREADLTVVYPVARGTGPLITATVAILAFGEPFSLLVAVGIGGIVAGTFLVAGGGSSAGATRTDAHRVRRGVQFGLATGACIACYSLLDGYSVKHLLLSPILVNFFGDLVRTSLLLPVLFRDPAGAREAWRSQGKSAVVVGLLGPVGYGLVLYAATMAPLSRVAPAREISMLFAAMLGGRLLGEGQRGRRLLGAACMAGGVVALAFSGG